MNNHVTLLHSQHILVYVDINVLSFGINSASEVFQNEIYKILQGLSGVINVSDDILVHGKNKGEHDKNLELVLKDLILKE